MARNRKSTKKRVDWSDKEHVEALIEQRKFLWDEDYVELLARRIGIKPGKTIADIGCGLGYLSYMYGKFLEPKGRYIGVDVNKKLLHMARKAAARRKMGKLFRFVQGGALSIPLEDESVDVAMCQTLLMHLKEPESAVKEMIRITKKRGKVVAFEPSWEAGVGWNNLREPPIKERLEDLEFLSRIWEGQKRLGEGDVRIGEKVPYLFMRNGLKKIQALKNNKVGWALIPPYDTPELKQRIKMTLSSLEKQKNKTSGEKRKEYLEGKRYYMAGGGDAESYKKAVRRRTRRFQRYNEGMMKMIRKERFYSVSTGPFYVIIGEK